MNKCFVHATQTIFSVLNSDGVAKSNLFLHCVQLLEQVFILKVELDITKVKKIVSEYLSNMFQELTDGFYKAERKRSEHDIRS